jgi:hypothetical protein
MSSWGMIPKKENKSSNVVREKNKTKVRRGLFRMIINKNIVYPYRTPLPETSGDQ